MVNTTIAVGWGECADNRGSRRGFHVAAQQDRPAEMWFQRSKEGLILFVVFYSQACRWGRCAGCGLSGRMSPGHVPCGALMEQVDYLFRCPQVVQQRTKIRKVIVSNNGSIFDQKTFARRALRYFLVQLGRHLPQVHTLTLETRPEYVRRAELQFIDRTLKSTGSRVRVEIAIGFEAFDDHVRNDIYRKGLSLAEFERFVALAARFGCRVKCYFMQKPVPEMTDGEAMSDLRKAMDYLDGVAAAHGVEINMHINPTYVAVGTVLEQAFRQGRYSPPRLRDVAEVARHARGKRFSVFVGLTDEGLAVEHGSFLRDGDSPLIRELEKFNRTQDFDALDRICGLREPLHAGS